MKKQIPIIQYVNDPRYKESIITQNNQNRPFASINGVNVKKIAEEQPYFMVEVDSKDGSLIGVPNSKDLNTYYTTQGKRYDKQPDGNWKDTDGHLWSRDDSGNFSIVKRNPETVTIGQNFADSYNSIADWFSKPIIVAGDEDTLGGYDGEYTTTPSEQIQIASVPLLWSKPVQTLTAIGGAYAGSATGGAVGKGLAYFGSEDPEVQKASERAGEFTGSLVGGSIAVPKLNPRITKINQKISTGARNLIAPYQKAFNYFSKNFNDLGPSFIINSRRAFNLLKSPSKVKVFYEYPELYEATKPYEWGEYSSKQFKDFGNIWRQEAGKQKFYFGNDSPVQWINPESSEIQIKNAFEQARAVKHNIDLFERYGKYRGNLYNKYYSELSKDAVWKSILDESPQYMDDIVQFVRSGRTDKGQFVKELIKRSNSYRRQMHFNFPKEQWLTLGGRSDMNRNLGSIDMEGAYRSGDYGPYTGWFEGQPTITGPIETWWSQRIPQGISKYMGIHSVRNVSPKFYDRINSSIESPITEAFFRGYRSTNAPVYYIDQPWHQVLIGHPGSKVPNFKVTLSDEMPKGFSYGKGYKTGGKLISKHRRQQNR